MKNLNFLKIAVVVVRTLMGLLFVFASIVVLFNLIPQPEQTGAMKVFNEGIKASVYLMPTVKIIELTCGIAFVSGRFVPLATILISPIIVNIFLLHAFIGPENLPIAIFLVLANSFIAYDHRESYKSLFKIK